MGVVPSVGEWLPGQAAQALVVGDGQRPAGFGAAPPLWWRGGRAALALLGYGLVLAVVGSPSPPCAPTSPSPHR